MSESFSEYVKRVANDKGVEDEIDDMFAIFTALEMDVDARSAAQDATIARVGIDKPLNYYLTADDMRAIAIALDLCTYVTSLRMMRGDMSAAMLGATCGGFLSGMLFEYGRDAGIITKGVK